LLAFAFDLRLLAVDVATDDFDATAFDADDFDADTFDATVAFDVDALDAFDATVACDAFDAVDAPRPARVILTRLIIGSLRWRLKVGVERNHRCVDGRKRMIR